MSDKIELDRRRVLGGIATVGAASAAVGAGTYAWFTDTAESTNNTIETGSLNLSGINTHNLKLDGLLPGEDTDLKTISATYTGDVEPVFDWGIEVEGGDSVPEGETDTFREKVKVRDASLEVGNSEDGFNTVNDYSEDENGNDISLNSLKGIYEDVLPEEEEALSDGDDVRLHLQFGLGGEEVDSSYESMSLDFGVAFHARQSDAEPLQDVTVNSS